MTNPILPIDKAAEIDKEYQIFLHKLSLLEQEQEQLIKEYRKELEERKTQQLRDELNT